MMFSRAYQMAMVDVRMMGMKMPNIKVRSEGEFWVV